MKGKSVKTFFDTHAHYSAYNKNQEYYLPIIDYFSNDFNKEIEVLDIGCGDGSFLKGLIASGLGGDFLGVDISFNLLQRARKNCSDKKDIHLVVADAFNLPFRSVEKFSLIHIDSVLHHLIDDNRKKSNRLSRNLLTILKSRLSPNGLLIVEEMYYNSRILPFLTSSIIFYSLKVINRFQLDLTLIRNDMKPGLEVNFFFEDQLIKMLNELGQVKIMQRNPSKLSKLEKLMILRERGHITFFVKT